MQNWVSGLVGTCRFGLDIVSDKENLHSGSGSNWWIVFGELDWDVLVEFGKIGPRHKAYGCLGMGI